MRDGLPRGWIDDRGPCQAHLGYTREGREGRLVAMDGEDVRGDQAQLGQSGGEDRMAQGVQVRKEEAGEVQLRWGMEGGRWVVRDGSARDKV